MEVPALVQDTVRVTDCPLSMEAEGNMFTVVLENPEFTVIMMAASVTDCAGVPAAESVMTAQ